MGRMSREKGKRGERELAAELQTLFGITARRGVQYHGGTDSPDVITDIAGLCFEVKRTERLSLYPAMTQAINDAGDKIPIVCHRQIRKEYPKHCLQKVIHSPPDFSLVSLEKAVAAKAPLLIYILNT